MPSVPNNGLENLEPAVRLEAILDGQDIEPVTRLEYFLKKAAEGGGGGSDDCNCLYNFGSPAGYAPFNVPDLINGGTRTFTPGVDHVYAPRPDNGKPIDISSNGSMLYTDKNPPGYLATRDNEHIMIVSWVSQEAGAFTSGDNTTPGFAIVNADYVSAELSTGGRASIINPANIVYMEIPEDK